VSLLLIFDVSIPTGGNRHISPQQILDNITSVVGDSNEENLNETVDWRLQWWEGILKDTVDGNAFWTGLGYGTDIAGRYGFNDWTGNRSPHNGHLTILARSGIPGITLWLILILTTYATLTRCYFTAVQNGQIRAGKINLWIMAYLTGNLVNMSFDVYLEGPQGGIWFWSLVGFAIALTYAQRANYRSMRRVPAAGYASARLR
jgi:O-antigen ligase